MIVITGTYGVLNLYEKPIYLADDNKVPVPMAFWKMVIYGPELEKARGMLIVTSNDPFKYVGNIICNKDKSQMYGWEYIREKDYTKGRTICCEFGPDILQKLPILNGAQPAKILDLNKLSLVVDDMWLFNEMGERTTWQERTAILEKLKPHKNLVDEKSNEADEKVDENLENYDEFGSDEKVPLLYAEPPIFTLVNKQVLVM